MVRKQMNYLLLDIKDITKVCGVMTKNELMKALGLTTKGQLITWLTNNDVLDGKYVVVEDM
jgi:hypothetical protein